MHNADTVLITGGSGTIGSHFTTLLLAQGYEVRHIGRTPSAGPVRSYVWDYQHNYIDQEALEGVHHIIHLAGADIAAKRWTKNRKQVLMDSRVKTAGLLHGALAKGSHQVRTFITASGISYPDRGDAWISEEEAFGPSFDGQIATAWEEAAWRIGELGLRAVAVRTGPVLVHGEGMLAKLVPMMRLGIAPYFGSGRQYLSWIHIGDLCGIYLEALRNTEYIGSYHAVAPNPLPGRELAQQVARGIGLRTIPLPAPGFTLRLALGELAGVLLRSARISPRKVEEAGFRFLYPNVEGAVNQLFHR